ncbi:hypothetical protein L596_010316 [Steinernema carpocapsae]|uniref:Uncharacterized protein n=1 Tax=Steinernema carpocapsae TaxID=34508 RepID=A0A4U5PI91_STECR|nr:hypothetical protein L596_010316 [Steinernema carpocapsae]
MRGGLRSISDADALRNSNGERFCNFTGTPCNAHSRIPSTLESFPLKFRDKNLQLLLTESRVRSTLRVHGHLIDLDAYYSLVSDGQTCSYIQPRYMIADFYQFDFKAERVN